MRCGTTFTSWFWLASPPNKPYSRQTSRGSAAGSPEPGHRDESHADVARDHDQDAAEGTEEASGSTAEAVTLQ